MITKKQVFYSFHFDKDVMRVQQIRNMGIIEGNPPVSPNEWEEAKKHHGGIEKWIDENMKYKACVVVLVGEETANRPWVQYEIKKAWKDKKGILGIYIHNIICPRHGKCRKGKNPFEQFMVNGINMSHIVECYNPDEYDAYRDISRNLEKLVNKAIITRKIYS